MERIMTSSIRRLLAAAFVGVGAGAICFAAQEVPPEKLRSNQLLMRDKLNYASKALEGLSMEDYGKIAEAGNMMGVISRAAAWHVIPTEEYSRMSKNFQEQARDLERHAKEKNLDAASLDYMRITATCVHCHNYIRANRRPKD
jgi:hypothetical protein